MFPDPGRRRVLVAAGSALAAAALPAGRAAAQAQPTHPQFLSIGRRPARSGTTYLKTRRRSGGRPTGEDGGYGTRSQFETEVRVRFPTPTTGSSWTLSPLQNSVGIITPSGLHFERHHAGIPTIDTARHLLFVHGPVERLAVRDDLVRLRQARDAVLGTRLADR